MKAKRTNGMALRATLRTILLGIVACASFVLQPIYATLHVGQHDHTSSASTEQELHWHVERGHDHEEHHRDELAHAADLDAETNHAGKDGHAPHPIEDHLKQVVDSCAVRVLVHTVAAPAEAEPAPLVPPAVLMARAAIDVSAPPTPPELRCIAPRAPPIAS